MDSCHSEKDICVQVKPELINSFAYEYACSGLPNISYRNINHSVIGILSALGGWEMSESKAEHIERMRIERWRRWV